MKKTLDICTKVRRRIEVDCLSVVMEGRRLNDTALASRVARIQRWMGPGLWEATTRQYLGEIYQPKLRVVSARKRDRMVIV